MTGWRRQASRRLGLAPLLALVACLGCSRERERPPASDARSEAAQATPQRVIAIAPAVVESVFAAGFGDRLVGVGDYAAWPEEVAGLPRIGGLYDPRFETIAALEPDLAILLPSESELAASLERLGVEIQIVPHETIADVRQALVAIASRLGDPEAGRAAARSLEASLARREPPLEAEVLMAVARDAGRAEEIYAAGPETFLGELLSRLGAANAVRDLPGLYPRLAFEEAVARRPEVVLELVPEPVTEDRANAWRSDWRRLAVGGAAPCVQIVDGSHVLLPGPRLDRLYRDLEQALEACAGAEQ